MRFICSRDTLMEGINTVQKAVSVRSTLPVLEGILVECGDNIKLTGNDLEMGIEFIMEGEIISKGAVVVNSKMFGEIVRRLPDAEITIEVNENNIVIIDCEKSHFELNGLKGEGFPSLPVIKKENAFNISQKNLKEMIRQTLFAVSPDDNRPILTGSLIEILNGELTFVSCDSYRVALRKIKIDNEDFSLSIIVPGKTLSEVGKILQPLDDDVTIYSTRNQIQFDTGRFKLVSRLIEGEYFRYRSFVPEEHGTVVTFDKQIFLNAIERASQVIVADERRYPLNFDIKGDDMRIYASTNMGISNEELTVETEGNDIEIRFNHRYMIDALKAIDDEKILICFTNDVGPCVLKPIDGDEFLYLIVPLRK